MLLSACIDQNFLSATIYPIIGTAIATMLGVLALFYMAGQFFKKPEYESFVSIEIHQLLVSVLIFITIFGASLFSCSIADSMAGGDSFTIAHRYLNMISNDVALPSLIKLEQYKMIAQWWGSASFRWGLSVWGVTVPGFPAFVVIERAIEFLLMLISPFIASLMAQEVGLEVIRGTMLPFILPAGVVLRIFPPTRDAGAFLICSAIGFQIIFPFTYVMHDQIVGYMIAQEKSAGTDVYKDMVSQKTSFFSYLTDYSGDKMVLDILSILNKLSYLLLQAIFLPALSMTLTIAFIKGSIKFISQKFD